MEKSVKKYNEKLASYRRIFSKMDNLIDDRLSALTSYEMMLNKRDKIISEYSVKMCFNK